MNAADRVLTVPGARLRYRDQGAGHAVVLVHGWTLDLDMWEPQAPLARHHRLLRYDRRGFGLSSGLPSLADDVADLHALLTARGVVSPLLVGMSQGARVVLEFAVRYPGAARALVLDGAPPSSAMNPIDATDLPMHAFRDMAAREGLAAFRKAWSAHPLTRLVTREAATHLLLAAMLTRYPGHDLIAPQPQPQESLAERLLDGIHTPALIINGAHDLDTRQRAGLRLLESLPAATRVLIENAAHLPNLDAPRDYNRLISEFASRQMPAAA
jgi:pimeloyl-ACP methyl ester carboxylesterase